MTKEMNKDIQAVHVAAYDLNGILRGKRIPLSQVEKAQGGGVRLPLSILGVDIWGTDVLSSAIADGDVDGLAEVTERGLVETDWTSPPTAMLPVWLANEDGTPYFGDSRRVLAEVVKRIKARGLTPVMATELEFYLVDFKENRRPKPPRCPKSGNRLNKTSVLSIDELHEFDDFLNDVYQECEKLDIPADAAIAENGCGQFEINLLHTDNPIKAADDAVLFKQVVKGVAKKHGFTATFMAKPFGYQSGSGFHIHCSMVDKDGNNLFNDGTDAGSPLLRQAVAGLLATMNDFMLVFAPHLNSYRRLAPGSHAPTGVAWGYENRTAAIRIPGGPKVARRIEHRVAGADANPYLVCAAVLGGMLYGIENALEPQAPTEGCVYEDDSVELLPTNWFTAIDAFEDSDIVGQIFPEEMCGILASVKRQEAERFTKQITQFEYNTYLQDL
ncbi:MAG: glutamine synthetase [Gammaproteobacteria bacterium]|nr:MAG: glutamine synthetase [Gammaproteobacteria bacterium]